MRTDTKRTVSGVNAVEMPNQNDHIIYNRIQHPNIRTSLRHILATHFINAIEKEVHSSYLQIPQRHLFSEVCVFQIGFLRPIIPAMESVGERSKWDNTARGVNISFDMTILPTNKEDKRLDFGYMVHGQNMHAPFWNQQK